MNDEIIIYSIKPSFVRKIIQSEKTVELRRLKPKKLNENSLVVIYASSPIQSLIGAFSVKKIIEAPLEELWKSVGSDAGVSREEFEKYFSDRDWGVAIFIDSFQVFKEPINLDDIKNIWEGFVPPQGFRYARISKLDVPEIISLAKDM